MTFKPSSKDNHERMKSSNPTLEPKDITFNPFSEQYRLNPYPFYDLLRMHDPVHQTRGWQGEWILTRYEDVRAVSRDARFRVYDVPERIREKGELLQDVHEGDLLALYTLVQNWMIFSNPPDHTRLRRLVSPAFSVRTIEKMRPMVQDLTDSLLVSLRPVGKMDIMSDLASPLTVSIIGKLLGVPDEDHQKLKVWSHDSFRAFESMLSLEFLKHLNAVAEEFTNYFWGLIEERRGHPQHDLISMLVGLNEQEDMLSDGELLGFCASLFAAGQETTLDLIGNGTLALLQHPEELERLQRDPAIIPSAIEELLRYESPVQFIPRIAKEDVEIGGKTIRAGERVLCGLGAANHDPEKFPHPHTLDLSRQNNDHVAFSGGIHHCLGAILARVEGQVVIPTLFSQLPDLQLATTTFERRENHGFRGLKALPVTWKI